MPRWSGSEREVIRVRVGTDDPVPILFWEESPELFVMPSGTGSRWLSESLRSGGCDVIRPDGSSSRCSVALVADPKTAERARIAMRSKYGSEVYARYFGPRSKVVRLVVGAPVVARSPIELLEGEFDADAAGYTAGVESNPIELYLKQTTRDRLLTQFTRSRRLLEIGAGTGMETLPLLSAGHEVVVVDLSPRMIENLVERARRLGLGNRLECRLGSLGDLGTALKEFQDGEFDGAYSTFGAFNLEADLGSAPATLARVLRPGSELVFTSVNRPGWSPIAWEFLLGNARGALARAQPAIPPGIIRYPLRVYPRNPTYWDRTFGTSFRRTRVLPVSVTAPPYQSPRLVRWLGVRGAARARRWDEWLSRRSLLAAAGEWSFLTYERRA